MASQLADAVVSREELAQVLGVALRTVAHLADEGMPKVERGRYSIAACVPWYLERERRRASALGGRALNDLDLARQRKTIAAARTAEVQAARAEAGVIPTELHEERLRERLESVATVVRGIRRYRPALRAAVTDAQADALLDRMSGELLGDLRKLADTID